ncbi:polysaccharide pyruvyl transferase family protein [Rhodococcus sp. NBC_00294]|uniref:polysaccharide pyruvyl transferase family protein n=1 Tax=Rhodococcus sp. NBC_00294 TaxID=2976004 RepID=UPI002E28E9F4|nr:polysaccharide pyruvyl transferase family protein [Rhodococcus sp. NBC_00294]
MRLNIVILHAYSADNLGDGLLVAESLKIVRRVFGSDALITICASYPETFDLPGVTIVNSRPGKAGFNRSYLRVLVGVNEFDAVVAVGGGYLRVGGVVEGVKTVLVHGPQLIAAALTSTPVAYLPQSIGPFRWGSVHVIRTLLRHAGVVYLRDDRSVQELRLGNVIRTSDLAILTGSSQMSRKIGEAPVDVPVLSVRPVGGSVPDLVRVLAHSLNTFDGYVQSDTGGNRDRDAMVALKPRLILTRQELMGSGRNAGRRVVVAVRLHAALMALRAGHFVIHLAYERKGFGAFKDLGLDEYVHNVNMFEPAQVLEQIRLLQQSPEARALYDDAVERTLREASVSYETLIDRLRTFTTPV